MNPFLTALALLAGTLAARAGTITNFTLVSIQGQAVTKQIQLRAGESLSVAQCLANTQLPVAVTVDNVRVESVRYIQPNQQPNQFIPLLGPALVDIILNHDGAPSGSYRAIVSLSIDGTPPPGGVPVVNIPSNAVVIPADAGGPVQVLLESSTDLITWNAALPGSYGTSTTNRFFRVRTLRP